MRDPSGVPIAQRYSTGQAYDYLLDSQGNVVGLEDPGTIQAAYDYCPTGNNPALPGTPMTRVGMANPLRQYGTAYDDLTKLYFGPNGTLAPDYGGVGTQTAGMRNGDAVHFRLDAGGCNLYSLDPAWEAIAPAPGDPSGLESAGGAGELSNTPPSEREVFPGRVFLFGYATEPDDYGPTLTFRQER